MIEWLFALFFAAAIWHNWRRLVCLVSGHKDETFQGLRFCHRCGRMK